ncbi:MAG: NADH-quinone oxidoreductase subunit L [Saprospiraceae bacterium]|jgi:NADH-quinone oxidoreductase subunit L|nr:NADH-quinone oxidoreductase subunit L [Saprospiraceae bacterium]
MEGYAYTIWIILLPFLVFLVTGVLSLRIRPQLAGWIGTAGILVTLVLSLLTAWNYFSAALPADGGWPTVIPVNYTWLRFSDTLVVHMGVLLDPISIMMLLVVSIVSSMVHIYSLGYMKDEPGFARYFAFLSLFSFSMYGLVLATNLFQIYFFWELVGVSSYLLIGFYYDRPSAVAAAKKAFIVTRFADFGFLVGILLLSWYSGTFDFLALNNPDGAAIAGAASATFMGASVLTWALVLIFMGGAGKSAMFPLHIWLPDAMEGPTPVSALIHAATMVVAGVYLVARLFPVYHMSGGAALEVVAWTGAITALFAALIAITQEDIKRVLAYSTMSQIGYMMLSLGVSGYGGEEGLGYTASMFHLFTHAMFKALLFLGAGAVIHAVHSNVMGDMGGLRKYLPITHAAFLVACLAIAGIPPLSGFFSKDEILAAALHHNPAIYGIALLVAGLTALYMFRLYFRVFWGEEKAYAHKPHEAPLVMWGPLMVLAALSVVGGFIPFGHYVSSDRQVMAMHPEMSIAVTASVVSIAGILLAMWLYRRPSALPAQIAGSLGSLYQSAKNKFYIDEIYMGVTKKILFAGIATPVAWFDRHIVDGTMNAIANLTARISSVIKGLQSGHVQQYAVGFVVGVLGLVVIFIYWLKF